MLLKMLMTTSAAKSSGAFVDHLVKIVDRIKGENPAAVRAAEDIKTVIRTGIPPLKKEIGRTKVRSVMVKSVVRILTLLRPEAAKSNRVKIQTVIRRLDSL